MKTTLKRLMFGMMLGAGVLMSACSDDVNHASPGENNGPEITEPTEKAFMALNLTTGQFAKTRMIAVPPYETETGEAEEGRVSQIRMVLYELNTNRVKYMWDLDATTTGAGNVFQGNDVSNLQMATNSRFVSKAKPVDKQDYKLLILVNPQEKLKAITMEGSPMEALYEPVEKPDGIALTDWIAQSNKFHMANHQDLIYVDKNDLKFTETEAEQHPFYVSVERGVAKILVRGNPVVLREGHRVENLTWDVDVTNKRMYWLRKPTHQAGYGNGAVNMEHANTFYYEKYAEDPNFEWFSHWNNPDTDLTQEFDYLTGTPELTRQFDTDFAYVLENTMSAEEQRHDVTTRVLIRATYIPSGLIIENRSGGTSFYTFKNYIIRMYDMQQYANAVQIGDLNRIPQELQQLGLAEALDHTIMEMGLPALQAPDASFASNGIHYYYQGICYYPVLIRHFDNYLAPTLMEYGRYGVVRNNVYRLNINSITGPGYPVIDIPGTDPDDDTTMLSADIDILEWQIRNQDVNEL